jgi:hypothetical protein
MSQLCSAVSSATACSANMTPSFWTQSGFTMRLSCLDAPSIKKSMVAFVTKHPTLAGRRTQPLMASCSPMRVPASPTARALRAQHQPDRLDARARIRQLPELMDAPARIRQLPELLDARARIPQLPDHFLTHARRLARCTRTRRLARRSRMLARVGSRGAHARVGYRVCVCMTCAMLMHASCSSARPHAHMVWRARSTGVALAYPLRSQQLRVS